MFSLFTGIEISFASLDFPVLETQQMVQIQMNVDRAQIPYTIILRPVSIDVAVEESMNDDDDIFRLARFLMGIKDLRDVEKATPGIIIKAFRSIALCSIQVSPSCCIVS